MTGPAPGTTKLRGHWTQDSSGRSVGDEVCEQIRILLTQRLKRIANGDWTTLYRDTQDGSYWELSFPESHHHGGGPPMLERLDEAAAKARYRF